MGARFVGETPSKHAKAVGPPSVALVTAPGKGPRPLPLELRGVHVTGALASLPGKFREYVGYKRYGLNTIELDVKDEGGEIGFRPAGVPLATTVGATRPFYNPKALVALAHRNGIYMIGRVVCFQDPKLAQSRPDLAIQRRDGSVWTTGAGLAWVNPYDRRVWDYCVSVAEAAADAGFDQIMFDYVRFPSDGDIGNAVYPGKTSVPRGRVIAGFVAYAKKRLEPKGVRVSTALFGLSATRDLGIGQVPRFISKYADTISPMSYPVLYGGGELGLQSPAQPAGRDGLPDAHGLPPPGEGLARAARAVGAGLELRPRPGSGADRRRAAAGREGIPALERVGDLHEGRARPARALTSKAEIRYGASRLAAPARRRRARSGRGRAGGSAAPARTRSPRRRSGSRPRTAAVARRRRPRTVSSSSATLPLEVGPALDRLRLR